MNVKDSAGASKTLKFKKLNQEQQWRESTRIALAATMIGFAVATFFLIPESIVTETFVFALKFGVGFCGLFSFLYILGTASHLKYKEPGYIQAFFITDGMRRVCFDLSVELFAGYLVIALFTSLDVVLRKMLPAFKDISPLITIVLAAVIFFSIIVINYKLRDREKDASARY